MKEVAHFMIKRLIFDVDNTLIVGTNYVEAVTNVLKAIGLYSENNVSRVLETLTTYEIDHNNYNEKDYVNHVEEALECDLPDNFLDLFFTELQHVIPPRNEKLTIKIEELSRHYELVLLTNFFRESQLNRLRNMGIAKYFSECYGEEIIKPNKEAYLNACKNHLPSECVMIGDSLLTDIKKAKELGLNTIFVNTSKIPITDDIGVYVDKVEDITISMIENLNNF